MKILVFLDKNIFSADTSLEISENIVMKINEWLENGGEVEFLTESNKFMDLKKINEAIKSSGLPALTLHSKQDSEKLTAVILDAKPQVFIESTLNAVDGVPVAKRLPAENKIVSIVIPAGESLVDLSSKLEDLLENEEVVQEVTE